MKPLDEAAEETTEQRSFRRRIPGILTGVLLALAAALLVYVTVCMVQHRPAVFFGRCILQVVTGSMEPTLHVGDCILVQEVDPATLQAGDIITYVSEDLQTKDLLITHRITEITQDGSFITRGDANPVEDALTVRPDQIQGKYIRKLHIFGFMTGYAGTRKLLLLVVMLGVVAMAVHEVRSLMKIGREMREESEAEMHERLMREAIDKEKARLAAAHYQPEETASEKEEQP